MTATKADGEMVAALDPRACYFCLVGAMDRACGSRGALFYTVRDAIAREVPMSAMARTFGYGLWSFNDAPTTTQADVLGVLDRAIVACG